MARYCIPYDPNEGGAVKSGQVRVVLISTDEAPSGVVREVNRRDVAIKSGATIESLYSHGEELFDSDYTNDYFFEEATQVTFRNDAKNALDSQTPLSNFVGRTIFMPYLSK
jgi:hypothetical protein